MEILDSKGSIGVCIAERLYSNGIRVDTYQNELDFCLQESFSDKDGNLITKKSYVKELDKKNLKLEDFQDNKTNSCEDIYSFMQNFYHVKKEISEEFFSGKEREQILSLNTDNLKIILNNNQVFDPKKTLLIELSPESLIFVKEQSTLMLEEVFTEGYFTHLITKTKIMNEYEHSYSFGTCDKNQKETFFSYHFNQKKYNEALDLYREKLKKDRVDLSEQGLSKRDIDKINIKLFQKKKQTLNECKEIMDKKNMEDLFISLSSSFDVLNVLVSQGSTITEL